MGTGITLSTNFTNENKDSRVCCRFLIASIALEVGFIIPLKKITARGTMWPTLIFGIFASVLLSIELLPPYFELAKRKGRVVGINAVFLTLDFSGALFSALSVTFANEVDVLGIVLYCIVGFMELGIFSSHLIWYIRFGRHLKNEKEPVDDVQLSNDELLKSESHETTKSHGSDQTV